MQTEDYAGAYQYFETGIALSDARAAEETIDGGLLKEMRYNVDVYKRQDHNALLLFCP